MGVVIHRGATGVHFDQFGVIGNKEFLLMSQRIIQIQNKYLPVKSILKQKTPLIPIGTRGGRAAVPLSFIAQQ
jgi:hypothetical protein